MQRKLLSMPELAIISGTRAALGAGVGLLVADLMNPERRKGVGWTLLGVGLVSTIPIVVQLISEEGHPSNGRTALPPEPTVE